MEANKTESLTNEELCRQIQAGRQELLSDLIEKNKGLIHKIAISYGRGNEQNVEDLKQECAEAICKCAMSYDPDRGNKFSSYATKSLDWACRRYLLKCHFISVPGYLVPKIMQYKQLKDSGVPQKEIQKKMRIVSDEEYDNIVRCCYIMYSKPASLDLPVGEDGDETLGDLIEDKSDDFLKLIDEVDYAGIMAWGNHLPLPEREIFRLRMTPDPMPYYKIAKHLGLTDHAMRKAKQNLYSMLIKEALVTHRASIAYRSSRVNAFKYYGSRTSTVEEAAIGLAGEYYDDKEKRWWE